MKTQIQIQRCGFGSKDERPAVGLVFVALLLALFLETCLLSPSPSPRLCRPRNGLTGWWWWWLAAMRLSKTYPNNNRGINNVCVRRRWLFLPDRLWGIAAVEMIGSMGIRLCIWSPLQGLNTIDNWDQVHSQESRWPEIANLGVSYWLIGAAFVPLWSVLSFGFWVTGLGITRIDLCIHIKLFEIFWLQAKCSWWIAYLMGRVWKILIT